MLDEPRRLTRARNLTVAHILRGTLEREGFPVELRGEARAGLAGQIPIPDAMVEVWVEARDHDAATALLARIDATSEEERSCPHCGEPNPGNFEFCWSCDRGM